MNGIDRHAADGVESHGAKTYLTINSGCEASCSTLETTEPSSTLPTAPMPRLPMQIRLHYDALACLAMVSATGPTRIRAL